MVRYIGGRPFLNVVYSTKNLSMQDRAIHIKEDNKAFIIFFLFLEGGKEKEGLMEGEGEHSGAFLKILHCIQDHKWNAKQGGGERLGLGLPIPIGPHKGTGAVERFHIAEPKGSTPVRDRSMSRRLVPAALKSTYALSPVH